MKAPDDYADLLATQPTRNDNPSPYGVRDLLLGFFFFWILGTLLASCAAPARLPLSATTRSAPHDPRTKTVEPALSPRR